MRGTDQDTGRLIAQPDHRALGPLIERLRDRWEQPKDEELRRLLRKVSHLDDCAQSEISRSFDRLLGRLLDRPRALLRDPPEPGKPGVDRRLESPPTSTEQGVPGTLIDATARLFQLGD